MGRILSLLTLLLVSAECFGGNIFNIDRGWEFRFTDAAGTNSPAVTVDLPHTWNRDGFTARYFYERGAGEYSRDVDISGSWRNKRVYLRFGGVNSSADLYVNGLYAGGHRGGYTAFVVDITPFVKFGVSNTLSVRADNSPQNDFIPVNGGFFIYGGMHRGVELVVANPVHISPADNGSVGVYLKQTKVSRENARIEATLKLRAQMAGTYTLNLKVTDPERDSVVLLKEEKVKIEKESSVVVNFDIPSPKLWDGTVSPFMYECSIGVGNDGILLDSVSVPLGLRYFGIDPSTGFMLNGKDYPLHGVTYYGDKAGRGTAMTRRDYERDMEIMLEMGVNAVRTVNYPQDDYFYTLCDRNGIIVWNEIPLVGPEAFSDMGYINKPSIKESGKAQLTEMILQHYNNPSVVFNGLFSNLSLRGDDPIPYIRELNDLAHKLDPTRLTVASSNQDGGVNFITDLIAWSQYFGWREGQPSDVAVWLDQLTREWKQLRSGIGEYGAGGSLWQHSGDFLKRPQVNDRLHPERWQTYFHEQFYSTVSGYGSLWGIFINSMFDYGARYYAGGETPGVSDMGLVTYDRSEKKDAFYYYKARWNSRDKFLHIAEKRWTERYRTQQSFRVFSNLDSVELFVNDKSEGVRKVSAGSAVWENVRLRQGVNVIEVWGEDGESDKFSLTVMPQPAVE